MPKAADSAAEAPSNRTGAAPVLETRGLIKRFPGVVALKGVDFQLGPAEVVALCGENGAGKSTLIKTLSGLYPFGSYEGEIRSGDTECRFRNMGDAELAGIGVIHQELALVPELSVAENIFLGDEPTRYFMVDKGRMLDEAQALLDRFKIEVSAETPVGRLGVGQQQLVEIAKAMRKRSRILILDEPTAALTEKEVAILLDMVAELRDQGVSCIYISHKLDEVFHIADRITVLRDGASISTHARTDTTVERVIADMVGRELGDLFPRRRGKRGKPVLALSHLSVAAEGRADATLRDISFDVHEGEVVGLGGLMGAGRSELLMHLFGVWGRRLEGSVTLAGEDLQAGPGRCIKRGLVLVSEDRKRFGLVLDQTVGFNLTLSSLEEFSQFGIVDRDRESDAGEGYVNSLAIKVKNLETVTGTLSGGNQQKVVLGKALMTRPRLVLLDEPTRGIDVGAKQEIYELINKLTADGVAVVLVSSELPELIGMSDRILMLAEGRVGGEFEGAQITQEALLNAAMGPRAQSPGREQTV